MPTKKIVITIGDPAGCGPQITVDALKRLGKQRIDVTLVGDREILARTPGFRSIASSLRLVSPDTAGIKRIRQGNRSRLSGRAGLAYLDCALRILSQHKEKRLVTAPVSKEAIRLSLASFCGHTEYLARFYGVKSFAMLMASSSLRVVLATRHISLGEVPGHLTAAALAQTMQLTETALTDQFAIKNPRMACVSVNPHAGVNTFLGKEEKVIVRAIIKSKCRIDGPFPADTIFTPEVLRRYDCLIAAYHDQGMIPFKLLAMKTGVNCTLGLPIIRTSPAHGVAYDLVRRGEKPFSSSMSAAISCALQLRP